jgi:hypothetical protein
MLAPSSNPGRQRLESAGRTNRSLRGLVDVDVYCAMTFRR